MWFSHATGLFSPLIKSLSLSVRVDQDIGKSQALHLNIQEGRLLVQTVEGIGCRGVTRIWRPRRQVTDMN